MAGGRPSIQGALGLNLKTGEEFLQYPGAVKSWSEVLSYIKGNYNISDEMYAICEGDANLQQHLGDYVFITHISLRINRISPFCEITLYHIHIIATALIASLSIIVSRG